ncbi:MAG TPA: MarR family transcriptional regulator [Fimbriimonadales bacterium]|jgi:DNA-binding transcriptional regulator GbsR (MarR family)|nr:MarR family transcriptional regulator [Fimbriimonadales bacterium]
MASKQAPESAVRNAQQSFILEWGRMASNWGINPAMAQIHALLFITGEPMSVDDIIERLRVSRSSISTNLRNLMNWGVVRKFRSPGDRKDTYLADTDALTMVARVVRERKRREIDPTVEALQACRGRAEPGTEAAQKFRERLEGLLDVFDFVDVAFRFAMASDERIRWIFDHREEITLALSNFERDESVEAVEES